VEGWSYSRKHEVSCFNLAASSYALDSRSFSFPFPPSGMGRRNGQRGNSWVEIKTVEQDSKGNINATNNNNI